VELGQTNQFGKLAVLLVPTWGLALFWGMGVWRSVKRGQIRHTRGESRRADDPVNFWLGVAIQSAAVAILFAVGLGAIVSALNGWL
jgi:hypothetical protein